MRFHCICLYFQDESENLPFPNTQSDFTLPQSDFGDLISTKRKDPDKPLATRSSSVSSSDEGKEMFTSTWRGRWTDAKGEPSNILIFLLKGGLGKNMTTFVCLVMALKGQASTLRMHDFQRQ